MRAIAKFKTVRPTMREAVGGQAWGTFGASLFVIGYSEGPQGGHMLLGQPSRWLMDQTNAHARTLGEAAGCTIEVVVRQPPWRNKQGAAE